ncbi:zinc-ribbon domain containing protein [[Clostridium] polysaccharolyticum]|uniref:Probable zinc-ribbon domain-containing protein n=1 Tax=[Clostridium] polysaccharolyticum TaxID=29364 RepID=A0A1I0AVG3_9FIRM|nr:zinc-ribbon domain containing protein [[Clostridium] polysaccharolyticum]SES98400.1 Probable zinc-ribbon domain-containing protein [[Clostridium] polysaccharolyticum]
MRKMICKQCGKEFTLEEPEITFYQDKGLDLPRRCKECRKQNKQQSRRKPGGRPGAGKNGYKNGYKGGYKTGYGNTYRNKNNGGYRPQGNNTSYKAEQETKSSENKAYAKTERIASVHKAEAEQTKPVMENSGKGYYLFGVILAALVLCGILAWRLL